MARLSPTTYKPMLSFRFKIIFSDLPNIQFYGKGINLPSLNNNPIELKYGNSSIFIKGRTTWEGLSITCYAYEGMTMQEMWKYLNDMHHGVSKAEDKYADVYKKDIQILLLAPDGDTPVATWKLIGAFMEGVNFGSVGWDEEGIISPELKIKYDYAELS